MHLQHRPLLIVTLPLHVAGLVLAALLVQPMVTATVPTVIVGPTGAHLHTVVVLPHQGVPHKLQLFVFFLRCLHVKVFYAYYFKKAPNPSNVLGVFGLSIRTQERDLEEEFSRFGRVDKVTIVYDQRVRLAPTFAPCLSNLS